jgi:hypothetical protein
MSCVSTFSKQLAHRNVSNLLENIRDLLPDALWCIILEYEIRDCEAIVQCIISLIEDSSHLIGVPNDFDPNEYFLNYLYSNGSSLETLQDISNEDISLQLLKKLFPGWSCQ